MGPKFACIVSSLANTIMGSTVSQDKKEKSSWETEEDEDEEEDEEDGEEESESEIAEERVPTPKNVKDDEDLDTDQETDRLLGQQYNDDNGYYDQKVSSIFSQK